MTHNPAPAYWLIVLALSFAAGCEGTVWGEGPTDTASFEAAGGINCGNGACSGHETCEVCPQDCGSCTDPTPDSGVPETDAGEPEPSAEHAIPGVVEAEAYRGGGEGIGYHDTTAGNLGTGGCRADDVDMKPDAAGDCIVGWFEGGEWLDYAVEVADDGEYRLALRVACGLSTGASFRVLVDGDEAATVSIPSTGSWDAFTEVEAGGIWLARGAHSVRIVANDYFDFDSMQWSAVEASACGDGTCGGDETCTSCAADCGACAPTCGDGTCDSGETCTSCAADCGACPPACGDGTCDSGETCTSCASDCGSCPVEACVGTAVAAGSDLAALASGAPAGTTFCLAAGTYRVSSRINPRSNQRFVGALGPSGERLSILTGSDSAPYAIGGGSSVVGVEVHNVVIERFASAAQQSPVSLSWPPSDQRWVFDNVESRYNHGVGLSSASNSTVRNSYIHHNLQMGLHGQGGGVVENNEIAYNNYNGDYDWGWEGGGAKWVNNDGLTVRNNWSHHNCGPGLWTDGNNSNTVYENNTVDDNHGPGIMHEIGGSAIIRNNTARNNAWGDASGLCRQPAIASGYVGGILISESHSVEAYGNTLSGNDGGIVAIDNDRGTGKRVQDLWVHHNDITIGSTGGPATGCLDYGDAYDCYSNNNRWDYNQYHVSGVSTPFHWLDSRRSWSQWRSYGFDAGGSID